MKRQGSIITLLNILIILFILFGLSPLTAFSEQESACMTCHVKFKQMEKNIHAALNIGCMTCHVTVQEKEHPTHKESIKLKSEIQELCYTCHKKSNFIGKVIHPPVAIGMCNRCHDAHQSEQKKLLKDKTPELCYQCHNKKEFTKKYVHKITLGGCGIRCHNPHVGNYPDLLSSPINDVCIGCHKAQETGSHITTLTGRKIHPVGGRADQRNPKKQMSCATCHNPHSSNFPQLFSSKKKCKMCHKYY